ncbi:MAG: hypothetical protein ACLFUS_03165 [Candidatus Sumerlaeia bacterium]
MIRCLLLHVCIFLAMACGAPTKSPKPLPAQNTKPEFENIQALDRAAAFNFAIVSDHKGDCPLNSIEMARMERWIEESGDVCLIGMGDHLKLGLTNPIIPFVQQNPWWRDNFYPNVADGENEYYGKGQGDYAAGGKILIDTRVIMRPNTIIQPNGVDYYSQIPAHGYTLHLIQLHYSDTPADPDLAFREESRQFLMDTLDSIVKTEKDIIVVGAHSNQGRWVQVLSEDRREKLMQKADLVLAATTHHFKRNVHAGYADKGALCINTGAATYPSKQCPPGYVQVHYLENPRRLIVQYHDLGKKERELCPDVYALVKEIDGPIYSPGFRKLRPEESYDRVITTMKTDISREKLEAEFLEYCKENMEAHTLELELRSGAKAGVLRYRDLFEITKYNNRVYILELSPQEYQSVFKKEAPQVPGEKIRAAVDHYSAQQYIVQHQIPESAIERTGTREVTILERILKTD